MCKVTPFLQGVAVSASVSTLTAIAFDRSQLRLRLFYHFAPGDGCSAQDSDEYVCLSFCMSVCINPRTTSRS